MNGCFVAIPFSAWAWTQPFLTGRKGRWGGLIQCPGRGKVILSGKGGFRQGNPAKKIINKQKSSEFPSFGDATCRR